MVAIAERTVLVELADIRAAVAAIEDEVAQGRMPAAVGAKRINDARRAVTPRDLWKATGGLAGAKKRSDWHDIRNAAFGATFLLILAAAGVWIVTVLTGTYAGDGGYIPDLPTPSTSVSVPAGEPPG